MFLCSDPRFPGAGSGFCADAASFLMKGFVDHTIHTLDYRLPVAQLRPFRL